ncbi:MAG TPA: hypothetical protein PLU85_07960 [Bacteroidia bacterium]|nr:hypothetical protein [Bacteroidia bacterium]MBP7713297.1 hypothetical protein [Bacteroidia bacterium]MBP8669051.1 hypothetical protein [Bacteroidia bacterium]HOZ82051.1 hypothetical protein [Bacteroidia bacterium]HOZ89435.1 hypothetical protein [Bacteroidia bacterium]
MKFSTVRQTVYLLLSTVLMLGFSCQNDPHGDKHTKDTMTTHLKFDEVLFSADSINPQHVVQWKQQYPYFFNLFVNRIIHLPPTDSAALALNLQKFVGDKDVKDIHARVEKVFSAADKDKLFSEIEGFLNNYKKEFGIQPVKHLVTFLSAFNYAVITADSTIGIGLDMYLGSDCEFYPSIGIPQYAYQRFSKDYILSDVIKGWYQSEHDVDAEKNDFLSRMIYYGKQLYFTSVMAPQVQDTILTGYSKKQLEWCSNNSKQMWAFFIENKLFYSTREMEYMKYIADGHATQGFPEGAPARTAQWLGWKIVSTYMKNNNVTLKELLAEKDAQRILEKSGYKP